MFNVCMLFLLWSAARVVSNIWTGDWYKRTIAAEQLRLGHPRVRLLPVVIFIDGTALDKLARKNATPLIMSLLNFTQEVLAMDFSKKLVGFYPDIELSSEQKQNPEVRDFLRQLHHAVTASFLDDVVAVYEKGGIEFVDSAGTLWNLVPVLTFMVTDTAQARIEKGVYESWSSRMPCHICLVLHRNLDRLFLPGQLEYRVADVETQAITALHAAQEAHDRVTIKAIEEELKLRSVKPWLNPWRRAPLGVVALTLGYFAFVWPETMHQLEGGLIKKAIAAVIFLMRRTGYGESQMFNC